MSQKGLIDIISGLGAGATTTLVLYPIDTIKTRFQASGRGERFSVNPIQRRFSNLRQILANDGFRSLYRGLGPAIIGSGASWGFYFYFYNHAKRRYESKLNTNELPGPYLMIAALEAGTISVLLTNPIWLLKTRLQLEPQQQFNNPAIRPYKGAIDGVYQIIKREGFLSLYSGVGPALMLTSHGAVQFLVYDKLKYFFNKRTDVHAGHNLLFGAFSKIIASTVTYPLQTVRTRLMDRRNLYDKVKYRGMFDAFYKIVKHEGIMALYRGIIPNTVRVTPSSALTLMFYEEIYKFLNSVRNTVNIKFLDKRYGKLNGRN